MLPRLGCTLSYHKSKCGIQRGSTKKYIWWDKAGIGHGTSQSSRNWATLPEPPYIPRKAHAWQNKGFLDSGFGVQDIGAQNLESALFGIRL